MTALASPCSQSMLSNFYGDYVLNFTFCSSTKILSLLMSALVINSFGFSRYIVITPANGDSRIALC